MLLELKHRMSKSGSNELWEQAKQGFIDLCEARRRDDIHKKIPQFRTLREKMYKNNVPKIYLEVAYKSKETGDIIIMPELESIPYKKFPPSLFTKLYESAHVKVINNIDNTNIIFIHTYQLLLITRRNLSSKIIKLKMHSTYPFFSKKKKRTYVNSAKVMHNCYVRT